MRRRQAAGQGVYVYKGTVCEAVIWRVSRCCCGYAPLLHSTAEEHCRSDDESIFLGVVLGVLGMTLT